MKRTLASRITAAVCALSLGACMLGNDKDSENKIDPAVMGQNLAASFTGMQTWQQTIANPAAGHSIPSSSVASTPALGKRSALAKAAGSADTCTADLSTSNLGYVTWSCQVADTAIIARVIWDAEAQDTIKDNEHIASWSSTVATPTGSNRVDFTDADGDGMVNVASATSRVRLVFTSQAGLLVETAELVVSPGLDLDFDAEGDNVVYTARWDSKVAGVLKGEAQFLDDDSNGSVADNAAESRVRVELNQYNPAESPLVLRNTVIARVRLLGYGLGDAPVSFRATQTLKTGRVNELYFRNSRGTEDFMADDSMHAILQTTVEAADDVIRSERVDIAFNPGADLKSDADDLFYSLSAESHRRWGWERDARFTFTPSAPVPHGQNATAGSFTAEVTFANGKSASLVGNFSPTGFTATFTGPEGNTVTVTYDANGNVIASN